MTHILASGRACRAVLAALTAQAILLLLCLHAMAQDLRGVALVIGQSRYQSLAPLTNPANDADAIEQLFDRLGFATTLASDRDSRQLRRVLDGFLEDAEGADVAVVYYAGHGIEAGGQNFLVPVDAELNALGAAAERLVPVSDFIGRLQATVPLAIVLLDACRDNPFPAGSLVRLAAEAPPQPMGEGGLSEARGATRIGVTSTSRPESFGTVLGFAAEPGKVALDGPAGDHSPYAAALLRHLDAMAGEEFGIVMRMVGEEVYLKTAGRQRPWINESLHRRLYFGKMPAALEGDDGDILRERRGLLLKIADLADGGRQEIERIARQGDVPMDALFALLAELGEKPTADPAALDRLLRRQASNLRLLMAEHATLAGLDPEIERLSRLSREAVAEGALAAAQQIRQRLTVRAAEVDAALTRQEGNFFERRLELAAAHVESARISKLAFEYGSAASYLQLAYEQVKGRDDALASRYRTEQVEALVLHGGYAGSAAALDEAILLGVELVREAEARGDTVAWATLQNSLGIALAGLGRSGEAVGVYRRILDQLDRDEAPSLWAQVQTNLGMTLQLIPSERGRLENLRLAVAAYREAQQVYLPEDAPIDWALTQIGIGQALLGIARVTGESTAFDDAIAVHIEALAKISRADVPLYWAIGQVALGQTLWLSGLQEAAPHVRLAEAASALRTALDEIDPVYFAPFWATVQGTLGNVLLAQGERDASIALLEEAVEAFRAALATRPRRDVPIDWIAAQDALADALISLGRTAIRRSALVEALDAIEAAAALDRSLDYPVASEDYWRDRRVMVDSALDQLE